MAPALLASTSMRAYCSSSSSASRRTPSRLARSATCPVPPAASAVSFTRAGWRPTMATSAPRRASSIAAARPIPPVAPVITTRGIGEAWRDLRIVTTVSRMVNDPFRALAHPIRRGIVERLAAGPATAGEPTHGFGVSKPAISKHLRVLEETGVLKRVVEGRTHRLSIEPDVLSEAADWMDRQRAVWERMFDVVDEYLKEDAPR